MREGGATTDKRREIKANWLPNRVKGSFELPVPTPPSMGVRTGGGSVELDCIWKKDELNPVNDLKCQG